MRRNRTMALGALVTAVVAAAPCSGALIAINWTYTNNSGTAVQRAAFEAAVADWRAVLFSPNDRNIKLSVAVEFKKLPVGNGGSASNFMADANNRPLSVTMQLSTQTDMFWDDTLNTANDIPGDKKDGYTVARHELGHALGFSHNPDGYTLWDNCVTGNMFDCQGVTATLAGGNGDANGQSHLDVTAHPGDLMNLTVGLGNRRNISTLDLQMLAAAFKYKIPEPATVSLLVLAGLSGRRRRRRMVERPANDFAPQLSSG